MALFAYGKIVIITNVMAASIDGRIATEGLEADEDRQAFGFSIKEDQEFVRDQIRSADVIITGANSMRASRKAWDQTGRDEKFPLWIVLSEKGLEPELEFWRQTHIPRWIVSRTPNKGGQPPEAGNNVEFFYYENNHPANFIIERIKARNPQSVLVFGGGKINKLFYEANLVNELKITICPFIIAKEHAPMFVDPDLNRLVNLSLISSHTAGDHVFLHYRILTK